jgi:hypothetical protein
MSDVQLLFAVVVALYLWECACWVRRDSLAFVSWLGRRWRALSPGTLAANQAGGFILAPPLPPLGTIFVVNQFPLSLSPEGVLGFVSTHLNPAWRPAQTGKFFRFSDIREVRARGRRLVVNGELLAACATPAAARRAADLLNQMTTSPPPERVAALADFQRASLDTAALAARRAAFAPRAIPLRWLANALFAYVFVLIPLVVIQFGLKLSWLGLLLGLLALTTATALWFRRAHRALYPAAEDERFTHTLTILLAPTTAMRAVDALARPLLEEFHPLAVARVLLPAPAFRTFARRLWLDLLHPAQPHSPSDAPAVRETELHSRRAWQEAVGEFLRRHGLDPGDLAQPPAPNDDTCRAYCPRCQAQFTTAAGVCADCGGLSLVAFTRD